MSNKVLFMPDVMSFEAGFHLYHVGGMGEVWNGRNSRFPVFGRLGSLARRSSDGLEFRVLNSSLATQLPMFRVAAARHVGLLAMPRETDELVRQECWGVDISPVVVSRTGDGRTLVSRLPKDAQPGSAKLLVDKSDSLQPRVLAQPCPASDGADGIGGQIPNAEIETVLYRFPERGTASAALGLLVGNEALAVPRAVINRAPVDSMPLDRELLDWARASGTPIV